MTNRISSLLLALSIGAATTATAQTTQESPAHVGFIYPLSTHGTAAKEYSNHFSLHVIAGVSGGEEGAAIAGVTNVIDGTVEGCQVAGFSNHVSGDASGAQIAGFLNTVKGYSEGIQVAGFANVACSTDGMQVAGFINKADNATAQAAGFINVAKDVDGAQIAGFVNIAKKVHGVQLAGFINIADSSDYPIGIINLVKNGSMHVGVTIDETATTLVSFRSGGRVLYGILGVGYNLKKPDYHLYGLEAGIGAHLFSFRGLCLNAEAAATTLTDFEHGVHYKYSLRLLPGIKLGKAVLFAGPMLSHVYYTNRTGDNLNEQFIWSRRTYSVFNGLSLGGIAGLQFRL